MTGGSTLTPGTAATSDEAVAICVVSHGDAADLPTCLTAIGEIGHRPLEVVVARQIQRRRSVPPAAIDRWFRVRGLPL